MRDKKWDAIWINATIYTCQHHDAVIENAAVAVKDGKFVWLGPMDALPNTATQLADKVHDVNGKLLTPSFIDCHTHLIYGGNRAREFNLRLQGVSYAQIAKQGGGILNTVRATRALSEEELLQLALPRAKALLMSGVTTLEIKSGYGLSLESEIKILRAAKNLAHHLPLTIKTTFLGAHTIAPEFSNKPEDYVAYVCDEMLPQIAELQLADAVDVFCENIAFNIVQTEKIFQTATQYGFGIKCHAEQLSNMGATALALNYQALSVDHLEYLSEESITSLANSATVAVLLPGAYYFLQEKQLPPIERLRAANVAMALASDANPGTSPLFSHLALLNLACMLYRLTPAEALLGVTKHAAKALKLEASKGMIAAGLDADFIVWQAHEPADIVYQFGLQPLLQLVKGGNLVDI